MNELCLGLRISHQGITGGSTRTKMLRIFAG
jgi:hypothetical protein